jgi:hypothetical protein
VLKRKRRKEHSSKKFRVNTTSKVHRGMFDGYFLGCIGMHNKIHQSSKFFIIKDTKMKKLLLGMALALMTLSATLYAACTQNVDMGTNRIINLGEPNTSTDAATKNYVDMNEQWTVIKRGSCNEGLISYPKSAVIRFSLGFTAVEGMMYAGSNVLYNVRWYGYNYANNSWNRDNNLSSITPVNYEIIGDEDNFICPSGKNYTLSKLK